MSPYLLALMTAVCGVTVLTVPWCPHWPALAVTVLLNGASVGLLTISKCDCYSLTRVALDICECYSPTRVTPDIICDCYSLTRVTLDISVTVIA